MKLNRLLLGLLTAGLALSATGVIAQTPPTPAPAKKAEPTPTTATTSKPANSVDQATLTPATKLEAIEVLGSRIRRTDLDGPSPVSTYDLDDIRGSGALNLADFLRTIPQTYNGAGSGRNSAPDDLNMFAGQRNETSFLGLTPALGASPILGNTAPVQTGVSGVSLRGLGSGSTLVLVDGRRVAQAGERNRGSGTGQGFVDLNTIPLGLIEKVEIITDGASAIYGADAVAGVINIVLKKSWVGTEVNGSVKMAQHGGGRERQSTISTGIAALGGKFRGMLGINYYDRAPLYASQRSFSKSADFRTKLQGYNPTTGLPVFGTDQRIQWGYPAVVQSTATTGFVSIPGVRVLVAPAGSATTPAISAFERRTTNAPNQSPTLTAIITQGQLNTNPAPFNQLVSASDRRGLTATGSYEFRKELEAYGTYSFSDSRGFAQTLPVYVANVTVAPTNNIFGEAIQFGMLLPQWGQIWQQTKTQTHTVTAGIRGQMGESWRWDAGYRSQDQKYRSLSHTFNATAFNAIANANDPAQRFNPFIDERVAGAPSQKALLAQTELFPAVDARSGLDSFDASANGDLYNIWGGTIRMALGGSYEKSKNTNTAVGFAGFPVVATSTTFEDSRTTRAAFSELQVPIFGKPNALPLLRRLEANLAGRYEKISDAGSKSVPKYGATWQPIQPLLIRGSYSEGFRAPSLTEDRLISSINTTATVVDPARSNQSYQTTSIGRSNPNLKPESSTNEFYGAVFEPSFTPGFSFSANFYRTMQKDAIQGSLGSVTILNNESLFPGFVARAAPTAADTAAGWKGVITTIYSQRVNFGEIRNESMDLGVDYRLPWEKFGRWRLSVNAAKTIAQSRQLTFGAAPINDVGDTFASPRWNIATSLYWKKGAWSANVAHSYMSGYSSNQAGVTPSVYTTPAMRMIDLRGTYEFKDGVWRRYGKGLRIGFGIANLEDTEPPFFNNIFGFNGGLHGRWAFGRTYEFSFILPLDARSGSPSVNR